MTAENAAMEAERVGSKTRRGLSWNLASAVVTNATRLAVVAVLGRALTSYDFGIVAAGISVNILFYSIRDLGVGQALVQQKEVDRGHLQTAFAVTTYLGLGLSTLLFLTAPLIEDLYQIEGSRNVIRAIGLLFVLRGLAITSRTICQRAMNFRVIAIIETSTFLLGSAVAMISALSGAGPWALVAGYLVEEAAGTVLFLILAPPPFSLRVQAEKFRDLMKFGTSMTFSQIAAVLAVYGDNFVVGHALGARMLGFYTRAYELIRFPSAVFDNIAGNVLFPAFARLRDDRAQLAINFRRAMFANAVILLPASAALFVVAPETIRILMGGGWDTAVLPFRILMLTMMMRTSGKVGQMTASATGGIRGVLVVNTMYMILVIGGAMFAIRWGIPGVATSTATSIAFAFAGFSYLAMKISGLPLRDLVLAHVPGLLLAAVAGGASWAAASQLRDMGYSAGIVFLAVAVVSVLATLVVGLFWMSRGRGDFGWLRDEAKRAVQRLRGRRPEKS